MNTRRLSAFLLAAVLTATAWAQSGVQTEGEVRKIDRSTGKITLKHGEIRNLEMPPMTMVFTAKNPALLDKVQVGDKVKFHAEKEGAQYVVTQLEAQR
ncbi:MAG: copper-binding protein [Pseudomonadota bacterium]